MASMEKHDTNTTTGLGLVPERSASDRDILLQNSIAPIQRRFLTPSALHHERALIQRIYNKNNNIQEKVEIKTDATNIDTAPAPTPTPASVPAPDSSASSLPVLDDASLSKKRKFDRGNNKPHERKASRVAGPRTLSLCNSAALGVPCSFAKYDDGCKFSHDIPAFLAARADDLAGQLSSGLHCPFHSSNYICRYGYQCRFLSDHLDPVTNSLIQQANAQPNKQINLLPSNVLRDLRMSYSPQARAKLFPLYSALDPALSRYMKRLKELTEMRENCSDLVAAAAKAKKEKEEKAAESAAAPVADAAAAASPAAPVAPFTMLDENDFYSNDYGALCPFERKPLKIDREMLYLAPLTTVGHLPFRRLCVRYGADITCGEMSICTGILQGSSNEVAHVRRHPEEKIFGVQLAGSFPDAIIRCTEFLSSTMELDFFDVNSGCPIDAIVNKGMGCSLSKRGRNKLLDSILQGMNRVSKVPITLKMRLGWDDEYNFKDNLLKASRAGVAAVAVHGRTRTQRYTRKADWAALREAGEEGRSKYDLPVIGNGDVYSFRDWDALMGDESQLAAVMIGRGALVKPWIFTEIKERRDWDISSRERFDMLKLFTSFGLEYFGSDSRGVETTRRFLLEQLSFLCRYVPVGLLDQPQHSGLTLKPSEYVARDDLEQLMGSRVCSDWVAISERLLGKAPEGFNFVPKHKSHSAAPEGQGLGQENFTEEG